MTTGARRTAVLVLSLAALVLACSSDNTSSGSGGTSAPATTVPADAEPTDFSERGPHAVGQFDIEVDADHRISVFYPVDTATVEESGAEPYTYAGDDILGPELSDLLPAPLAEEVSPPDTWVGDLPAADGGPFPVVLHSHGFSGHYKLAGLHNSHVASWGHVVASVDHPERGLLGTLGLFEGDGAEDLDTRQLLGALDLLGIENDNPDSVLAGAVDSEQVATEGHSAGGRASGAAAYDDRIDAWIGQAPGPPVPADAIEGSFEDFDFEAWAADNEPPDVPSLVLAAEEDIAIPLDEIRPWFDWLAPPKRLVVLDDAGHNAFTDVCEPIQEADGIASFVEALGFDPEEVPFVRLGEDGCLADDPPAAETWAAIDHVTVAQLRWVFDREPEVAEASLETSYLDERFPGAVAENEFVGSDATGGGLPARCGR